MFILDFRYNIALVSCRLIKCYKISNNCLFTTSFF